MDKKTKMYSKKNVSVIQNNSSSTKESESKESPLLKIAQINLQHKRTANDILMDTVKETKTDIVLITEPYISKITNSIPGVSHEFEQHHQGYGSLSAIIIRKNVSHFRITEFETKKLTVIKINNPRCQKLIIASLYCPRGDEQIAEEMKKLTEKELKEEAKGVIGLDSNAHSVLVGYDSSDKRAQEWEEFMAENELIIHNNKHSHTFENTRGFTSKIDWTITTSSMAESITNWKVREDIETLSDHNWI